MGAKTWLCVSSHASADCLRQTLSRGISPREATMRLRGLLIRSPKVWSTRCSRQAMIEISKHPITLSVQPMNLWIIKNRHIMLRGWKSGGMLQMLLSKTPTSGVGFCLGFFFLNGDFFPSWRAGGMYEYTGKEEEMMGGVWKTRWGWRAECQGLSDMGSVGLVGWSGCVWMRLWVKPSSNLHARQLSLPLSPSLSPPLLPFSLTPWSDGLRH